MSIVVTNVTKHFGDFVALDDVSVDIPTGELTALLGPSGGGKSTLLRIIAGLESADRGTVEIEGVEATHLPAQKRNVGFVFQHYAAFKHLTVARNVAFGLEIRKRPTAEVAQRVGLVPQQEEHAFPLRVRDAVMLGRYPHLGPFAPPAKEDRLRVAEALERCDVQQLRGRTIDTLSGGEWQRVRVARALAQTPRALLLDEPTVTDALRALAGSFMATGAGEIVVSVEDDVGLRLSPEQRTHMLAIAKEALSNSIRHTKADTRTVTLRRLGNKIRLEVTDNGYGFSTARRAQGMGLQNMRARARKLRGRIAITSVLGQGTTVTLTIPST